MARFLARLIEIQAPWARPLGDFNKRWLSRILRRLGPVKDLLHGRWLGHPLHSATTDVPVGALTVSIVLYLLDLRPAADIALVIGVLFMIVSALAGAADYADTDGSALMEATVHSTLMVLSLLAYLASLAIRAGDPADRWAAIALSLVGYALVVAGAYVGGRVVFALGNMVSRHVFGPRGGRWIALDLDTAIELADGVPGRARAGVESLLIVRQGATIHALHEKCAHAGGPLSEGRLVDGCIECPWHGSRFRLADGRAQRGPTVYDQPRYEIRLVDEGWEARRIPN